MAVSFIFSAILILMACEENVGESEIPSIVVNTFRSNYPDADEIEWESDGKVYEIDFEMKNVDHSVRINRQGEIIKKKQDINLEEVPQAVREYIKDQNSRRVNDLEMVEDNGIQYYQVVYANDKKIIDENGRVTNNIQYWK